MTLNELKTLLAEGESTYLDWKRDFPRELLGERKSPEWDRGRGKLLKDLIALANSHGSNYGYLIYGVEDLGIERRVLGISRSFDDADFQQWAENTFVPPPTFRYSEGKWNNSTTVGVFRIEHTTDYPHVVQSSLGGILFEGQVWFRRGSKNTVALREDLKRMFVGDTPFKISKLDDRVLREISNHYKEIGRETRLPRYVDRDSLLAQGYELATYPGTRREIWVGAIGDRYEHILLLKPKPAS
jgi:predicted HTH transcriptional regulator